MNPLRLQYEKFPYPPISSLALPRRDEGASLEYRKPDHRRIRILVIGGGTLEPLIVASSNPFAHEIVNVEWSEASTKILRRRIAFSKFSRPFQKLAPIRSRVGDFNELAGAIKGQFDFVIASNVLHHFQDPAQGLRLASDCLKMGGLLRMVTYPRASRIWMRETSKWLKRHDIENSRNLRRAALQAIRKLPISHPVRACFESHPEAETETGIRDAFFNACENPLSPLEWQTASEQAGLDLIAEDQEQSSRSSLLNEVAPSLSVWEKLQILDDTWELCSNPILWFEKTATSLPNREIKEIGPVFESVEDEIAYSFRRADELLRKGGSDLEKWQSWLAKETGPRVWPKNPDELLRGLSITEYPIEKYLLRAAQPTTPLLFQPQRD